MAEKSPRNPDDTYFEYQVIAGTWKGLEARLIGQPQNQPDYADFELREGAVIRGPVRLPLNQVKWLGPRAM
jgi:hypothetical protein